jgi:formylglycine-generating enzyme required for sulfatase activity
MWTKQAGLLVLMLGAALSACAPNGHHAAVPAGDPAASSEPNAAVRLDMAKGMTEDSLRPYVGRPVTACGWYGGHRKPGLFVCGPDQCKGTEIYILGSRDQALRKENELAAMHLGTPVEVTGMLHLSEAGPARAAPAESNVTIQWAPAAKHFYFDVEQATVKPVKRYAHSTPSAARTSARAVQAILSPDGNGAYPLWDGKETVAQYAKRAGIKETQLTLDLGNDVAMKLSLIPAGKFMMGSSKAEQGSANRMNGQKDNWNLCEYSGEGPQHEVTISRPFYIGVYTVTQRQYEAVLDRIPAYIFGPDIPVEYVSCIDAAEFCKALSEKAGLAVEQPTEAQWEYACRAGTTTMFYWGDDPNKTGDYAWYASNSGRTQHPVGLKKPNAWGLYDMCGNVSQWCADWFDKDYYSQGAKTDPTGPQTGNRGILRGGNGSDGPYWCRSAAKNIFNGPYNASQESGFRVIVRLK